MQFLKVMANGVLMLTWCTTATAGEVAFDTQPVATDGMFNNRSTTQVDADGVVHTAFMTQFGTDDSSKEIVYANNAGGMWTMTPITNNNVREEFPDLALDDNGNVHIAVHTGTANGNKIRYVNNVGGSFGPIIDITGEGYVITEIAVDSEFTVHFTFRTQTLSTGIEEVFYTTWSSDEGVGPLENISNTPSSDSRASHIAVGPDDVVHIVYQEGNPFGGNLVYVNNASGDFEQVETGVGVSIVDPILMISPDNVVSIAFRDSPFLYVIDDGGAGSFSDPVAVHEATALPAFYEGFTVDDEGRRYFAFASNVNDLEGVYFIRETDDGFQPPQQLATKKNGNLGTSVAINDAGQLAVTYSVSNYNEDKDVVAADLFAALATIGATCPADIAGDDSTVNVNDLLTLLGNWGTSGAGADIAEPNDVVDVADLLALLAAWGPCQ